MKNQLLVIEFYQFIFLKEKKILTKINTHLIFFIAHYLIRKRVKRKNLKYKKE